MLTFITSIVDMIPKSLFYIIALMLAVCWAVSFFYWNTSHIVHILIALAIVFLILGLRKKKETND